MRRIIHIDMDAFYASVEQRDHPHLRGKPVIVGGHPKRGVVLAASYEVRPFGVRSAMPMSRAVKLAPKAIVVPPRPSAYAEASEAMFEILESVTPQLEPLSLDEAFLDVTASRQLFGSAWEIALALRQRISKELQLPVSAGIASGKGVAKIASDFAKPNGQKEVLPEETKTFLGSLSISRLWGVGPKTEERLRAHGLDTVGDLQQRGPEWLEEQLGELGMHLWQMSQGDDDREVVPDRTAKSIGSEDTFDEDVKSLDGLLPHLHAQAWRVARRLRRAGMKTRVVQLKIKYSDFQLQTRRVTLEEATDDGQTLYRQVSALLTRGPLEKPVRLTGVSAQELHHQQEQLNLFAKESGKERVDKLNAALDGIASKFGTRAVTTADLVADERESWDEDDEEARRKMGATRTP